MYPIALDLRGRSVVVVGGGSVAERKVRGLVAAGARITVVALKASDALRASAATGAIGLHERGFEAADLDGATLAFAATNDAAVNRGVAEAARARRVLVDDTADSTHGDFSTAMSHRVGPLTFAVDTGGASPSFAIRLIGELRERFDQRYGDAATALGRAREYVKTVVPADMRAAVMAALASRDVGELAAMDASAMENAVEAAYDALQPKGETHDAERTPLRCATRASALATWQTRHVMAALAREGVASTLYAVTTIGDRVTDRPLEALGTDGIFVAELERALRDGRADYAVHSCKDLPSSLPDDMRLAAVGARIDPRDAFCSERYPSLDALPPDAVVGTSSPRRRAQLARLRPDLRYRTIRGNVDTRLRKLRDGEYDAIVLAMAGLRRLGLRATFTEPIDPDVIVPAVGQGALAIEVRASDTALAARIHAIFADPVTEIAVAAERAFLRTLRGGCQTPVGAHATYAGGTLTLHATIASPSGADSVRGACTAEIGGTAEAEAQGEALARRLLREGGAALLHVRPDDATRGPLDERVLLLPRTQERLSQIAAALRGAGAEVVEATDSVAATRALDGRTPDALLFPSSGSVQAIAPYLAELRAAGAKPLVAAMGEASSAAARSAGFPPDVVAAEPTVGAFVQSVTRHVIARNSA